MNFSTASFKAGSYVIQSYRQLVKLEGSVGFTRGPVYFGESKGFFGYQGYALANTPGLWANGKKSRQIEVVGNMATSIRESTQAPRAASVSRAAP